MTNSLRALAAVALAVVLSIVWVVYRTVERAQDSNQWVVHTQEVLTAIETVLSKMVDAESAVRSYLTSADEKTLEPLGRAQRTSEADVNHVAALTADNPSQQQRAQQLRQDLSRTLAALRAQVDAQRAARAVSPTDAEVARVSMDASRGTMQSMRAEENRLLVDRVRADQAAVRSLQRVSMALLAVAMALMAWIIWLLARNARRQQHGTEVLQQAKEDLVSQVGASAADLRDSNRDFDRSLTRRLTGSSSSTPKAGSKRSIAGPSDCLAVPRVK